MSRDKGTIIGVWEKRSYTATLNGMCTVSKCERCGWANKKKHGISFEEVMAIFDDPCFTQVYDGKHSKPPLWGGEERIKGIGLLHGFLVATVIFCERGRIRIISARPANKKEEALYYEYNFECDFD